MKNIKKLITMALATVMAVSTMSFSAFAEENSVMMEDKITVYTFNKETNSFDVSYEDVSETTTVMPRSETFNFSQKITSSLSYLLNTTPTNEYLELYEYMIMSDTTLVVELTSYDINNNYYFEIYKAGTKIPSNISSKLTTPICEFRNLDDGYIYSVKLKKDGDTYLTTGKIYSK